MRKRGEGVLSRKTKKTWSSRHTIETEREREREIEMEELLYFF